MVREIEGPDDWAELCTYIGGVHEEAELTPVQFAVLDALLGLSLPEPYSDDHLVEKIIPAVVAAASAAQAVDG